MTDVSEVEWHIVWDILPREIATKEGFENAMSLDVAMGGSTNTVLHFFHNIFL